MPCCRSATATPLITALAFVGDPAGQHQRLRWLRGDPPDARHVLEELTAMTDLMTVEIGRAGGVHRRRPAVHPRAGRAVPARDRQGRQHLRHGRHGGRAGRDDRAGDRPRHLRGRAGAAGRGDAGRCRDRAVAGPGGRDDRDARADRAAALASSVWPRCWSAGTATCTSRPTPTAPRPRCSALEDLPGSTPPRCSSASSSARSPSPARSWRSSSSRPGSSPTR